MSPSKRTPGPADGPPKSHEPATLPEHLRHSRDRIYEAMMRGGGEPFGAPLGGGLSSLTQWVVRKLKQRGFFGFETYERPEGPKPTTVNKFTRYGAAPFRGDHNRRGKP
jgi:hypothetical protein